MPGVLFCCVVLVCDGHRRILAGDDRQSDPASPTGDHAAAAHTDSDFGHAHGTAHQDLAQGAGRGDVEVGGCQGRTSSSAGGGWHDRDATHIGSERTPLIQPVRGRGRSDRDRTPSRTD